MIAAAGLGSRLGLGLPKCLALVDKRPILEHQLALLKHIPDVRLVVGYREHDVIPLAFQLRPDIIIVRNPSFRTTTTQHSYWLGAEHLTGPCLYLDGDIIFEPNTFAGFLAAAAATTSPLIAVTPAKTEQAVFVTVNDAFEATAFSRASRSPWEWANLALLPPSLLEKNGGDVFARLAHFTPLAARAVDCYEVDTENDLAQAEQFARELRSLSSAVSGSIVIPTPATPSVA